MHHHQIQGLPASVRISGIDMGAIGQPFQNLILQNLDHFSVFSPIWAHLHCSFHSFQMFRFPIHFRITEMKMLQTDPKTPETISFGMSTACPSDEAPYSASVVMRLGHGQLGAGNSRPEDERDYH